MSSSFFAVSLSSDILPVVLETGWFNDGSEGSKRVIARQVIDVYGPNAAVMFETLEELPLPGRGFKQWLQAIRVLSLTATATPCLAVFCLAIFQNDEVNLAVAILALVGVVCLQITINVFNDVEDYKKLIDLPGTEGGSGVIQKGWWTANELRSFGWKSLFVGVLCGMPTVIKQIHSANKALVVFIALVGGLGVLTYSAKKMGLKYHALGDLAAGLLCGPLLTMGFALALKSNWAISDVTVGLFFGFLAAGLMHVNNLQDMILDRARDVKTFALVLGFSRSKIYLWFLYLAATCTVVVAVYQSQLPLLTSIAWVVMALLSFPWLLRIQKASGPESALLAGARGQAAKIHLTSGVVLCVSLLLARILK